MATNRSAAREDMNESHKRPRSPEKHDISKRRRRDDDERKDERVKEEEDQRNGDRRGRGGRDVDDLADERHNRNRRDNDRHGRDKRDHERPLEDRRDRGRRDRDRDHDKDRDHDRNRDRRNGDLRSPAAQGRSTPSNSSAPLSTRHRQTAQQVEDVMLEDGSEEQMAAAMQRVMGFSTFKSTKNTKVPGNDKNFGIRREKKTEYRQYMNRVGGFNRPLSPSRSS